MPQQHRRSILAIPLTGGQEVFELHLARCMVAIENFQMGSDHDVSPRSNRSRPRSWNEGLSDCEIEQNDPQRTSHSYERSSCPCIDDHVGNTGYHKLTAIQLHASSRGLITRASPLHYPGLTKNGSGIIGSKSVKSENNGNSSP